MSGDGFTVRPDALRAAAERQEAAAEIAGQTAGTVESATARGNLFGMIGQMAGLDASYRGWVAGEVTSLNDLAHHLADIADGLRANADEYEQTDAGSAEQLARRYPERS